MGRLVAVTIRFLERLGYRGSRPVIWPHWRTLPSGVPSGSEAPV